MKIDILKLLSHFVSLFEGRMAVYVALVPGAGSEDHTCFLCPPAVRQYFISSVALGIRPGIAAQAADFEACSVAFGDLGSFSAHPLIICRQDQAFSVKVFAGGRQGKGAVFTLRKLEAQFSLQRLYLLREDGGWEM